MSGGLRRDPRFRSFWAAQSVSQMGDRVSELALPLIAVGALHATAVQVSWLTALVWTPNLLAVLLGAWTERRAGKRALMVTADLARAVLLLTVPAAALLGVLTLAQLCAVALLTGLASVVFGTAYPSFFARLVPRSSYVEANSALSASRSFSFVAGPALGGVLVQLLTAPFALVADALSFLASALLLGRVRVAEPTPVSSGRPRLLRGAREGLAFVLRHPLLRAGLGGATTVNFFTFLAGTGLLVLFAERELGLSPGAIGFTFGVGAVGGILGAVAAPAVSRLIGVGRAVAVGAVLFPAPYALVWAASGPLWARAAVLAAAEFLSSVGVMLFDVNLNSLMASVTPDSMRSRVAGAFTTVNYGVRPFGALAGGALATLVGLRPTITVAAAGGALSALWVVFSPVLGIRALDRAGAASPSGTAQEARRPESLKEEA
ncbi:MFS transporter [Streptomyces sp. NPDC090108]|uniref:MFS transporter n=1 Tax=Streptomyces sp. NPDC090108 TaxID=3365947 RepID=UPI00381A372F